MLYDHQKLYFSAVVLEKQVTELLSDIPDLNVKPVYRLLLRNVFYHHHHYHHLYFIAGEHD